MAEIKREKAVPRMIDECLKMSGQMEERATSLEASLGSALTPEAPPPEPDCEHTPEQRCAYEVQLRELLATLERVDSRLSNILARLEV